jgi:hypothetical protein
MQSYSQRVLDGILPLSVGDTLPKAFEEPETPKITKNPVRHASYAAKTVCVIISRSATDSPDAFCKSGRPAFYNSMLQFMRGAAASPPRKPKSSSISSLSRCLISSTTFVSSGVSAMAPITNSLRVFSLKSAIFEW